MGNYSFIKKNAVLALGFIFLLVNGKIFANSYSGSSDAEAFILRAPIWVFLEPTPGYFSQKSQEEEKSQEDKEIDEKLQTFLPPKEAVGELSRFILSGMAYGFKFSYTPYDKKRGVKEFFGLTPKFKIEKKDKSIRIRDIKVEYPYCYFWAEYRLPETYRTRHNFWDSGTYKIIKGRGKGNRFDETKGVYDAYTEAVKNAVRQYARKILKNKPKEIIGEVLIKEPPRLFVKSGYFNAEVECYLNIIEVVPYTVF